MLVGAVHFSPDLLPEVKRLIVEKVKANGFENVQRSLMKFLKLLRRKDFERG